MFVAWNLKWIECECVCAVCTAVYGEAWWWRKNNKFLLFVPQRQPTECVIKFQVWILFLWFSSRNINRWFITIMNCYLFDWMWRRRNDKKKKQNANRSNLSTSSCDGHTHGLMFDLYFEMHFPNIKCGHALPIRMSISWVAVSISTVRITVITLRDPFPHRYLFESFG